MWRSAAVFALAGLVLGTGACGPHPPSHDMLDSWVDAATEATVKEEFGLPSMSLPRADGITEWRYRFSYEAVLQDGVGSTNEVCWHYTLTFDEAGVLRSWQRERCQSRADPLERIREQTGEDAGQGP